MKTFFLLCCMAVTAQAEIVVVRIQEDSYNGLKEQYALGFGAIGDWKSVCKKALLQSQKSSKPPAVVLFCFDQYKWAIPIVQCHTFAKKNKIIVFIELPQRLEE
jgi:hypothetical protein